MVCLLKAGLPQPIQTRITRHTSDTPPKVPRRSTNVNISCVNPIQTRISVSTSSLFKPQEDKLRTDYINRSNLIPLTNQRPKLQGSSFGTINARSIRKNLNTLKFLVQNDGLDILSITETWLRPDDHYEINEICPPGYNLLRADRNDRPGGGVGFLIRNNYKPKVVKTSHFSSFEHMVISVASAPDSVRFVVIYRPPSLSVATFMEEFGVLLEDIALGGSSLVLSGDFNLRWDVSNDSYVRRFKELCSTFGLIQHVNEMTHIKGHVLDLILSREVDDLCIANVRVGDAVSDHFLVRCNLSIKRPQKTKRTITYRNLKTLDIADFSSDVSDLPLVQNYEHMNLDELVYAYDSQLREVLDKHAPLITRTTTSQRRDPWETDEVLEALRVKRRAERRFRKAKTADNFMDFRKAWDNFTHCLDNSKTNHLCGVIEENSKDPKSLFAKMNTVMHNVSHNPLPEHTCAKTLADEFNAFFKLKVDKIRDELENGTDDAFENDMTFQGMRLDRFQELSEEDVLNIIKSSKAKSCELDPLPAVLFKHCIPILLPVVTKIVNLSLTTGTFPDVFKRAIIRPQLKKPTFETELNNYRPVSNLSYLSKVIEAAVNRQLTSHLVANSLNQTLQSAYKPHHSTETALIAVLDGVLRGIDKPNTAFLIGMLDMSAAFDTVNHSILLERLRSTLGVTDIANQWFKSYLSNRRVTVSVENVLSDEIQLDSSLPQGSILGPRLYSDYTQPMGNLLVLLSLLFHCYADDTGLSKEMSLASTSVQFKTVSALGDSINAVEKWTSANKLKLNPTKTEFMVICGNRNRSKVAIQDLDLTSSSIKASDSIKSLGVILDNALSMETQINNVCKTCIYFLNWIRKIRKYLTVDAAKTLVQAYIISRIDYCNSLYASLPRTLIWRLQRVMNIAARIILQMPQDCSITTLLAELHWLKVEDRIVFKVMCITWKSLHGSAPKYIRDMIRPYTPNRPLRSADAADLHVPRTRTRYGDRSFSHVAPTLWNSLPNDIRSQTSFPLFKRDLKTFLFRKSYTSHK